MHDPSSMALALIVSEKMTKHKNLTKVYAEVASGQEKQYLCLTSVLQARQRLGIIIYKMQIFVTFSSTSMA